MILIFPWELGIKPIYLSTGKKDNSSEIKIEGKIQDQMGGRGWSEKDIQDVIAKGAKGKSVDQRRPKNTDDGLGRNDPATVYGEPGKYVVVNDRTGEVAQVSNKNDPRWIDDSRIQWEKQ
ncbi:colicin E5-related ribonuclease [Proteus mirabilis]